MRDTNSKISSFLLDSGFSFVYLAEDQSGRHFAMKKIRCTFGTETVEEAMKEVEMYRKFPHRNIIKVLVRSAYWAVVGDSKGKRNTSPHLLNYLRIHV